ncbi:hypothetical protein CACET_c01460 [Clostridium aceticum]|uniref:Uncharacterized protein n=1 Tax=Clostridium aceticum TaxID=84022 RepID=A0A0D8IAY4_9CLOT|nr:hypothetical protein [Clostridium aceticum]AKL93664.1 hypothetical protein CACET_c01460 [Clostridium aceticum]KJF27239.1 hypothetical protein TZ02_09260 [Clostridium aceticum]
MNYLIKRKKLVYRGAKLGGDPYIDIDIIVKKTQKLVMGDYVVISCYSILTAGGGIRIDDEVISVIFYLKII